MTVRLAGVAALVCDAGHVDVVDDALYERLAAAVDHQLLTARRRLLRRGEVCGSCGGPLRLPPRTTQTPVVDDSGPSVVTLMPTLPMVRCPDCAREQVSREVADQLDLLVRSTTADLQDRPGHPQA